MKKRKEQTRLRRPCSGKGVHKGCGKMFTPTSKNGRLCEVCLKEANNPHRKLDAEVKKQIMEYLAQYRKGLEQDSQTLIKLISNTMKHL